MTTTTDFAVLGLESAEGNIISDGFSVRYDSVQQAYIIDTPFFGPGKFEATSEDSTSWTSDSFATILKPKPANPASNFEYTTFGRYYACPWECYGIGVFAFGTATPQSAVPTTGTATYDAIVSGLAFDTGADVGGTASLQFNFGAGTLAGAFNPILNPFGGTSATSLGTYTFVNTVFGVGSTSFSGELQKSGISQLGSFNGLFTGPAAQELMARWKAPYINPSTQAQSEIFGAWIGRKQ